MKRTTHKTSRIPRPEPADLQLQTTSPDDCTLARPRGRILRRRSVDWNELHKLEATKRFGGLLPEGNGEQAWQCVACLAIYHTQAEAVGCCQKRANRIQQCKWCKRRLVGCTCPPLSNKPKEGGPSIGGRLTPPAETSNR
jgi:hypothetical protein